MAKKTEEDWFLRGGERPDLVKEKGVPSPKYARLIIDELAAADDDHDGVHEDGDGGETLRDYIVTMSRRRTVRQTAKVRVKAHSEDEAMDLTEDRAENESDSWFWSDDACSEDFEDVEAEDVEVAP